MEKFIENLIDVMDIEEEITADTLLENLEEWDSLSLVSFMAMANSEYGKRIVPADVKMAKTVADLYELVK